MKPDTIHLADHWSEEVKEHIRTFYRGEIPMASSHAIERVCRDIAKEFRPERIILFGSYAYGDPTPDSDVDILVVMPFSGSPNEQAIAIRNHVTRQGAPFAMDLLVRTPEWVAYRATNEDWFVREILERGKVMYEAAHA